MIPGLQRRSLSFAELQAYVAILIKHLRLMILLVLLSLCAGLFYYTYRVPVYYSRALINYEATHRPMDAETIWRDSGIPIVRNRLQADHIIVRAAAKLGVQATPTTIRERYIKKIRFQSTSEHDLEVQVHATTYELAEMWVRTTLETYIEYRDEQRMRKHESLIQSYTQEIANAHLKMEEFDDRMAALMRERKVVETQFERARLKNLPTRILQAERSIEALDKVREVLQDESLTTAERLSLVAHSAPGAGLAVGQLLTLSDSASAAGTWTPDIAPTSPAAPPEATPEATPGEPESNPNDPRVIVVPAMLAKPTGYNWEEIEEQRRKVAAELAAAGRKYLPGHRLMRALQARLAQLDGALNAELRSALTKLELEHKRRLTAKARLDEELPLYHEITRKSTRIAREISEFEATRLGWEKMVQQMTRKLAELDFAGEKDRYRIEYAGLLQLNENPVSPHRLKLTVVSLAFGIALALGAAFSLEYLDHTISMVDQVEKQLGLPGIGVIPRFPEPRNARNSRPVLLNPEIAYNHSLIETFRVVRTNLLTNKEAEKPRQVIMIASSVPREGKSMVAMNLASAFALLGEKTLLIDADLRRGKVHRTIGRPSAPGLSDVLQESTDLEKVISKTPIPELDVLTRGKYIREVPELLTSDRFAAFMASARQKYKRIVLDTPPVLGLSETCGMLPHVDGVVMVVWSGYTPIEQLRTATEMLASNGATFYGCILNRLDLGAATNYQHYYYYSNYYYQSYRDEPLLEAGADVVDDADAHPPRPDQDHRRS